MASLIDRRLHASLETKQHETLLRVEGIADKANALVSRSARDALLLIFDGSVVHRNRREAAAILNGIIPGIGDLFNQQFHRLHYWSYDQTVRILAKQIPRRWFRKVLPDVITVGEAAGWQIPGTNMKADTSTEPVANSGERLTDPEWADFLKKHLFQPPTPEQAARAVYTPVNGQTWQQRLDVLSHKITDMDRLSGILVTGASSGMSQAELKRQIQPVVQNIASSAARIARTEGLRIATSAQREQYSELGDMLAGVQIIATLDDNTRPHHAARNGRIYWNDRSKKPSIDQLPMLPDEPNCRCYDSPVLHPPEEFENDPELRTEFLNAAGSSIPDPQVYGQWFDRADVGRRKQAVGSRRYDEVVKKLGASRPPRFEDFIDRDGHLLSVQQLKSESANDRTQRLGFVQQQMQSRQVLLQKMSRFGFVSANDPGIPPAVPPTVPPANPFYKGITAPVSKALKLEGTKAQRLVGTTVLSLIDEIHGDGDLPNIPFVWSRSKSWSGAYKSRGNLKGEYFADSISISVASPHPHMTAAHEIGHFLDQQAIGLKKFASSDKAFSALFDAFDRSISESRSYKFIHQLSTTSTLPNGATVNLEAKTREHLKYLLRREELFARAYAQWVASKSKNQAIRKELAESLPKDGRIPYQWSDEDFQPIAQSLESMFQKLGWLR